MVCGACSLGLGGSPDLLKGVNRGASLSTCCVAGPAVLTRSLHSSLFHDVVNLLILLAYPLSLHCFRRFATRCIFLLVLAVLVLGSLTLDEFTRFALKSRCHSYNISQTT